MEVPIFLQSSGDSTSSQKKLINLHLTERQPDHTKGKRLQLRLTDSDDPFFYFGLVLADEDFQKLKQTQGLLVEFNGFGQMLEQLVAKCVSEAKTENPKFHLVLETDPKDSKAMLMFQEINPFRHLTHLSLIVMKGSDVQVSEIV